MNKAHAILVTALALSGSGSVAAVFTVGTGGTYSSLQSALVAAASSPGSQEIRIAAGTFPTNVTFLSPISATAITISGGWNLATSSQSRDAGLTVLDGQGTARVLDLLVTDRQLTLDNLTITRGLAPTAAGLNLDLRGGALGRLTGVVFSGNRATTAYSAEGGGLEVNVSDTAQLEASDCTVSGNQADSSNGSQSGGGLVVNGDGSSTTSLQRVVVRNNTCSSSPTGQVTGCGAVVELSGAATAALDGCVIRDNTVVSSNAIDGSGLTVWLSSLNATGTASITNTIVAGNAAPDQAQAFQVDSIAGYSGTVTFSDLAVVRAVGAAGGGIEARSWNHGTTRITNCTIADNPNTGLQTEIQGPSPQAAELRAVTPILSVTNSIITGSRYNLSVSDEVAMSHNLVGVEALFANSGAGDYHLQAASPAIDAGTASPPGALPSGDLDGLPRWVGDGVDLGAYEVQAQAPRRVPAAARTTGYGGVQWKTDAAVVNVGPSPANVTARYTSGNFSSSQALTIPAGGGMEWPDTLLQLFSVDPATKTVGQISLESDAPWLAAASRNYADGGDAGTYGQFFPYLAPRMNLTRGMVALLPGLKNTPGFYTNIGVLNTGEVPVDVQIQLRDYGGGWWAAPTILHADPGIWVQVSKIFDTVTAGTVNTAYATAEVLTTGAAAWVGASVVDAIDHDPTTVPAIVPLAAGTVFHIPGVVHTTGYLGVRWRTTIAAANAETGDATLTVTFRSGSDATTRTATVPYLGAAEWDDVLVDLFGYSPDAKVSGSLEITSDLKVAIIARNYADKGADGTYGQYFPALTADDGITSGFVAVLPLAKSNDRYYTNVGVQNVGTSPCTAHLQLHGASGVAIGNPFVAGLGPGAWTQLNDVFANSGAGSADVAYGVVTVDEAGCQAWANGSVIDRLTRDPTTVAQTRVPANIVTVTGTSADRPGWPAGANR